MYQLSNHTFVICAYKESPYLDECIKSIKEQTLNSKIIMITSTPNDFINETAKKNDIELFINNGESGIVQDWNFGYSHAKTKFITLAHQDDIYSKTYTEEVLIALKKSKKPIIAFTDYYEIRNGQVYETNKMLQVKRLMLSPLKIKLFHKSRFIRRRILSFGCPICCPSVTFNREAIPFAVFQKGYRSDEDWQAWERLSKLKGEFVYCHKTITYHRIHQESETTVIINDNIRSKEDYEMFCMFWPKFIAKKLVKLYSRSEKLNDL